MAAAPRYFGPRLGTSAALFARRGRQERSTRTWTSCPEESKGILQTVVGEVFMDRNSSVDLTLAKPSDDDFPESLSTEPYSVAMASEEPSCRKSGWSLRGGPQRLAIHTL